MSDDCTMLKDDDEGTRLYFTISAYIIVIGSKLYYDSCENENCMKKVFSGKTGEIQCGVCKTEMEKPKPRFISNFAIADDTGSINVMASGDELCHTLFNKTPEQLKYMCLNEAVNTKEFIRDLLFEEFKFHIVAKKN